MSELKIVSLFSGCGGLDLGFKKAGFRTVFATDIWDIACQSLKENNIADEISCEDVRKIDFTSLLKKYGVIDCVIGGPPCPPYSQTRHYLTQLQGGFKDEKAGFAVPEYFRAIKELNPKVFVFENVDGFCFKTHQEAFEFLKEKSLQLGYEIIYKVINCADYGAPQTRKRFFCIGAKKGCDRFSFPHPTHSNKDKLGLRPWVTCKEVIGEFDNITVEESSQRPGGKDYELFKGIPPGGNYLFYTEKRGHQDPKFKWKSRYWTFLLKLSPDKPSWTIQASFSRNQGPFHWRNRFLRIDEIRRLQTFPDNYKIEGTFNEQWRQIGNAVPPLMGEIIAKQIKEKYYG